MTLSEIKALLVSADPNIKHYFTMDDSEAYSFWEETRRLPFPGDDRHDPANQAWKFFVHRFTKIEGDPMAATIFEKLDEDGNPIVNKLNFGNFISSIITFLILAIVIFAMIKGMNKLREATKKPEPEPEPEPDPEPSAEEKLLTEIRDLLKKD